MNILVIGSGGREHAIVCGLADSAEVETIYVAPGNGGTALVEKAVNIDLTLLDATATEGTPDDEKLTQYSPELRFALANDIDLVVIGPEAPLVEGLADELRSFGVAVFGPGQSGARLEGSKHFSKDFMSRHQIPTAKYGVFTKEQKDAAYACIDAFALKAKTSDASSSPLVVVKADGLAAGKGVTVASSIEQARKAVDECFDGRFGDAGETVVIEACLTGSECSMIAFVDGTTVLPLAPSQDHKRVGDGDTGPNTGGMGCYSPVPSVTDSQLNEMTEIMQHTAKALASEGIEYRGILYAGFMLTEEGPQILEFNVRFGDPETQVLLPRLKDDLAILMMKTARGELAGTKLDFIDAVGVCVVMCSAGYPEAYSTRYPITGISLAEKLPESNMDSKDSIVRVYHAGTKLLEDEHGVFELVTAGGRVLNVVALAPSFEDAIAAAYRGVGAIDFEGAFFRQDIASRALVL